jgi:NADPH:quinone reductase-like Zn-dependent oxidoreductase
VQIAAAFGARVVATASQRNHDLVHALGAETVIDYTAQDFVTAIRNRYPDGVDKALNGVSGETANQAVQTSRDGGRMVDLTGSASVVRLGRLAWMFDDGHLFLRLVSGESSQLQASIARPRFYPGCKGIEPCRCRCGQEQGT